MRTRLLLYKKFCIIFVVLRFQCKEQGGANVGIKAQRYRAFYQHIAGMEVGETACLVDRGLGERNHCLAADTERNRTVFKRRW